MGLRSSSRLRNAALLAFLCGVFVASAAQAASEAWQKIDAHRRLSASEGATYSENEAGIELTDGAILTENRDDYPISSQLGAVKPKHHSLLFVRVHNGCEHIFVLLGGADVIVGNGATTVNVGEEAIVADHTPSAQELIGEDYIGRRRLRVINLPQGESMGLSEFSLVQAVEREPILYKLMHSSDSHDKALRDKLIKAAAVLNYVTGRHGQYVTGVR